MTRVIPHAREPLDQRRHAGQRPQLRGKAVAPRSAQQRLLHPSQLPAVHPALSPQPADCLQALPPLTAPRVVPAMRGLPTDLQRAHDHRLGMPVPEQPRGFEATRFQRGNVPSIAVRIGHAAAWDGIR